MFIGNAGYGFSSDCFHRGMNINFLKLIYGNKQHSAHFLLCQLCLSPVLFSESTMKFHLEQLSALCIF